MNHLDCDDYKSFLDKKRSFKTRIGHFITILVIHKNIMLYLCSPISNYMIYFAILGKIYNEKVTLKPMYLELCLKKYLSTKQNLMPI